MLEKSEECELHIVKKRGCPICYNRDLPRIPQLRGISHRQCAIAQPNQTSVIDSSVFLYTGLIRLCFTVELNNIWRVKNKPSCNLHLLQTRTFTQKCSHVFISTHQPCVTCLRTATIIDDRGEDCYAWPVQDAIRDCDWEPFENVSHT